MGIGANIRMLRRSYSMTREELAARMEVSPSELGDWEDERTEPGPLRLRQLCAILQTTPELLAATQTKENLHTSSWHVELHARIAKLARPDLELIAQLVEFMLNRTER